LSAFAFWNAIEIGLVYGFVALGVFLSFRVLAFPDLTVDGSFPLGAMTVAALLMSGDPFWGNPWMATLVAFFAGSLAGLVTAGLNVIFRILHLLASILTMYALYSINLRVGDGRPNLSIRNLGSVADIMDGFGLPPTYVEPVLVVVLLIIAVAVLTWFLTSDFGLGMRATGLNPKMARAQGVRTNLNIYVGMAISNGLVAVGGGLFAQTTGFADATSGVGTIVFGLAAVIVGETLIRFRAMWIVLAGCIAGSLLYRLARQAALEWDGLCVRDFCIDIKAYDLNLITALIIVLALVLPRIRRWRRRAA
jgi:putative ABC transport system permease protein